MKRICSLVGICCTIGILSMSSCLAQKSTVDYNLSNLKQMPYMQHAAQIDCNKAETTHEFRICANLELQKQDSLLTAEVNQLLNDPSVDEAQKEMIVQAQKAWKEYRFVHCQAATYSFGDSTPAIAIDFMNCCIELTKTRRTEIKEIKEFYSE